MFQGRKESRLWVISIPLRTTRSSSLDAIDLLFSEAKCSEEQRAKLRVHFLHQVTVSRIVPEPRQVPRTHCRDLSPFGVGLLHTVPLDPQDVVVHMRWDTAESSISA